MGPLASIISDTFKYSRQNISFRYIHTVYEAAKSMQIGRDTSLWDNHSLSHSGIYSL